MKKKYKFSNKKFKGLKNKPYKKHSQNKKSSVKSLNKKKSTKKLTKKQKAKPFPVVIGLSSKEKRYLGKRVRKSDRLDYDMQRSYGPSVFYNEHFPSEIINYSDDTIRSDRPSVIYNKEFPSEAFNFSGDTYSRILKLKAIRSITGRY